jgi:uncharacterized protein GlcG (DUF336 family)
MGVLPILGGYAAEAVEQVLQRLVEVLLALVRGDGSAQLQAKAAAEKAETSAKLHGLVREVEAARGDEAKFKEALQKILSALK